MDYCPCSIHPSHLENLDLAGGLLSLAGAAAVPLAHELALAAAVRTHGLLLLHHARPDLADVHLDAAALAAAAGLRRLARAAARAAAHRAYHRFAELQLARLAVVQVLQCDPAARGPS